MEQLTMLLSGFATLFQDPWTLILAVFGVAVGIVIGALPGLTATMGVAIILPFTFGMAAVPGLTMICGVYFGGVYAGAVTAILLRIPGTPAAAATAIDGYELTKKGEGGKALGVATFSSFTGGFISILMLVFLSPILASFALKFSAAETFALAVFGLSIIASISGSNPIKGLMAGFLGLIIATIGLDPMGGFPRFTWGIPDLMQVPFIPVMIGLFAASEAFKTIGESDIAAKTAVALKNIIPTRETFRHIAGTVLRSTFLGAFIGCVPGAGADIAAFVAYNEAKRFSKHPENFGKGEVLAVAACESGANGCTGGAMLPMLTLGVPGDAVTAVMLGALTIQGMQPGPLLFRDHADKVFTLFAGMLFCYVIMLAMGLGSLRFIGKLLQMPKSVLTPLILALSIVGSYAINNNTFDIGIMLVSGVIGYVMQKYDFPPSPVVLALIMGPMAESNFRRALTMTGGSYDFLWTRPITVGFLLLAAASLLLPVVRYLLARRRSRAAAA
ncbi:MAG: tripartite tricarboxylate transporter permease [Methylobacteriaceae bacterium]|jgi:putative tricarboxylic transport membrane protein|nr:tripartite tricarboxylate transporter permease [Methylobacteriaceae bacterium]